MPISRLSSLIAHVRAEMGFREKETFTPDEVLEILRAFPDSELSYSATRNPNPERRKTSPTEQQFAAMLVGQYVVLPLWARYGTLASAVSRFNALHAPRRYALRTHKGREYRIYRLPDIGTAPGFVSQAAELLIADESLDDRMTRLDAEEQREIAASMSAPKEMATREFVAVTNMLPTDEASRLARERNDRIIEGERLHGGKRNKKR